MDHSQVPTPFYLNQDFSLGEEKFIPSGARVFKISKDYLQQNSFPQEIQNELLMEAEQAKSLQKIYVHCPEYRKCISVPPSLLDEPIR